MADRKPRRLAELDEDVRKLEEKTPWWQKGFAGLGVLVGLVGGFIGAYTGFQQNIRTPDVDLEMPADVQLVQIIERPDDVTTNDNKPDSYKVRMTRIYVQPAFVNTGQSHRHEVLNDILLYVKRTEPYEKRVKAKLCRVFRLDAIGNITNSSEAAGVEFVRESGASPLVVTQTEPANQALAFEPSRELEIAYFTYHSDYLMTLVAQTAVAEEQLMKTVRVSGVAGHDLRHRAAWGKKEGEPPRNRLRHYQATEADAPSDCQPSE